MAPDLQQFNATILSFALVVTMIAGVTLFGAAVTPVAADQHTFDDAPDLTDEANFRVNFPNPSDHYPGDQNEEGGSIQYFAAGDDAYEEVGAEDGLWMDMIIIDADWIDYSACETANTEVFGIDRGNNNEGTQIDQDLLQHQRQNNFRDDGITIWFYEFSDFGGDPPYIAPEDAIVAAQGQGSSGGPCLTVTSEPGWYQVQGFTNGTVADNGPDEQPSESAEDVGLKLNSNYLYVCDCDSEEEAREELGAPPDEETDDTDEETPTPTPEPVADTDDTDDADEETPTPTSEPDTPTPTTEPANDTDGTDDADDADADDTDGEPAANDADDGPMTPAAGDGAGFGPIVAILALLASALLAHRRR